LRARLGGRTKFDYLAVRRLHDLSGIPNPPNQEVHREGAYRERCGPTTMPKVVNRPCAETPAARRAVWRRAGAKGTWRTIHNRDRIG
jgi:hypothetical protein